MKFYRSRAGCHTQFDQQFCPPVITLRSVHVANWSYAAYSCLPTFVFLLNLSGPRLALATFLCFWGPLGRFTASFDATGPNRLQTALKMGPPGDDLGSQMAQNEPKELQRAATMASKGRLGSTLDHFGVSRAGFRQHCDLSAPLQR